jgi:hypothetical protein
VRRRHERIAPNVDGFGSWRKGLIAWDQWGKMREIRRFNKNNKLGE